MIDRVPPSASTYFCKVHTWMSLRCSNCAMVACTTTSTLADRAIHHPSEDRRASPQAAACASDRPAAEPERATNAAAPRAREPTITLVPLDSGLVIRKRAVAQTGDVQTGQESAGTPPQWLINNPPSGSLSVGNLRGGRVTVLGVTEETILPGTTKGP